MNKKIKIFTGNANRKLCKEIVNYLDLSLGKVFVGRFSDNETFLEIKESVRGCDVFIIQSTSQPANENLMELLILIDALSRASAKRITAVIPYYGYARQERKTKARDPITAKLVANLLTAAGTDRILSIDLHASAIQGFFDIPFDHLPSTSMFAEYYNTYKNNNYCVVSPDLGGVTRARNLANRIKSEIAIIDKRRSKPNKSEAYNVLGDVKGKDCIMIDDMIDTAGTIIKGATLLKEFGAKTVRACCTHAVFSGDAFKKIKQSVLKEVIVTNTIQIEKKNQIDKIKILSIASFIGNAISCIYNDKSVSDLIE